MSLSQQLDTVLNSNGVPADFAAWLIRVQVLTVTDFVLAARGELQHVETDLIAGSSLTLSMIDKISVRRAWGGCSFDPPPRTDRRSSLGGCP